MTEVLASKVTDWKSFNINFKLFYSNIKSELQYNHSPHPKIPFNTFKIAMCLLGYAEETLTKK